MTSRQTTIDYILEQAAGAGVLAARKMFGDYALYCDTKVVALICDDQVFVKPTAAGKAFIGTPAEAPPYHGAKPWFLIEDCDDREWLSALIKATAEALPLPKPKAASKRRKSAKKPASARITPKNSQ